MYELKIRLPNGTRINLTAVKGSLPEVAQFIKELPMSEAMPVKKAVPPLLSVTRKPETPPSPPSSPSPPSPLQEEKESLSPRKVNGKYEF